MIHWLRTSAFRTAGMVLCVISSGVGDASQAQEPGGTLKPGEALVIVKVTGDVKALLFQRFQGDESFVAESHRSEARLLRVKPGRYYLKSVTPVHMGITLPSNPEPREPSQTVAVREGMVNYIGDWHVSEDPNSSTIRYDYDLRFNLQTVRAIIAKHQLPKSKMTMLVSKTGEMPIESALP